MRVAVANRPTVVNKQSDAPRDDNDVRPPDAAARALFEIGERRRDNDEDSCMSAPDLLCAHQQELTFRRGKSAALSAHEVGDLGFGDREQLTGSQADGLVVRARV